MEFRTLIVTLVSLGEVLWIAVYVLILHRSLKDKTYGFPMFAICSNLAWEYTFTFILPYLDPPLSFGFYAWFALDLIVLYTYLRFGRATFPARLPSWWFSPLLVTTIAFCFFAISHITRTLNDWHGLYSAFSQCLIMSILFIRMGLRRPDLAGQSLYTAGCRWLATAICAVVSYLLYPESVYRIVVYILIFCCDASYVLIVYRKSRELGFDPWRRL